jgi:hypothetical protein
MQARQKLIFGKKSHFKLNEKNLVYDLISLYLLMV